MRPPHPCSRCFKNQSRGQIQNLDKAASNPRSNGVAASGTIKRRIANTGASRPIACGLRTSACRTAICRDGLVIAAGPGDHVGLESRRDCSTAIVPDVAGSDGILTVPISVHFENGAIGNESECAHGIRGSLGEEHLCEIR